ncbi:MAG: GTP-binding protein [candidate division WOR-3 bacterium]
MSERGKISLHLLTAGHKDHGKSTALGHMLLQLGQIDLSEFKEIEKETSLRNLEKFKFAWIMMRREDERYHKSGTLTIDISRTPLRTPNYIVTLVDAPGHQDFVKNMIKGASISDAVILFVSAKSNEGVQRQTIEHVWLCKTLGIKQVIVAISKMDLVNWSEERFNELKAEVAKLLDGVGYDSRMIPFIPISGLKGDNLVKRSENMPWYKGPTLYEAIDKLEPPDASLKEKLPLRIPIQKAMNVTGIGTVILGKIETGFLRRGDHVLIMPSGKESSVKSIQMWHKDLEVAKPGDGVGIKLRGIAMADVDRGFVICHPNEPPPVIYPSGFIISKIIVLPECRTVIREGFMPDIHIHEAQSRCRFVELISKLDPATFEPIEDHPKILKANDAASIKIAPLKPLVVEKYSKIPSMGRFVLRERGITIAVGIIDDIKER